MSMKFINENPRILRAWIDGKKELMEEYEAARAFLLRGRILLGKHS